MKTKSLDDIQIIRNFVDGQGTFMANRSLRVETALDTQQLMARNGQILAIYRLQSKAVQILVRPQSNYADLLQRTLRTFDYLPMGEDAQTGFQSYEAHDIPEDYHLNDTTALKVWQRWWKSQQHRHQPSDTALMIFTQGQWSPILAIAFNHETVFITTSLGETVHHVQDRVIWLEPQTDEPTQVLSATLNRVATQPTRTPQANQTYLRVAA